MDVNSTEAAEWSDLMRRNSALENAVAVERERCAKIAGEWLHGPTLLLRAGEMTAQEKRTCLAVVAAICCAIRERSS